MSGEAAGKIVEMAGKRGQANGASRGPVEKQDQQSSDIKHDPAVGRISVSQIKRSSTQLDWTLKVASRQFRRCPGDGTVSLPQW